MPQEQITLSLDPVRESALKLKEEEHLKQCMEKAWYSWNQTKGVIISAKVMRIHFKPHERCRLVVNVKIKAEAPGQPNINQVVYIQIYRDHKDSIRRRAKYLSKKILPSFGPPVFLIPEHHAVAFSLPNGPRLRKLAPFFDHPKLQNIFGNKKRLKPWAQDSGLRDVKMMRYVPRKRVLLRIRPENPKLSGIYIKIFNEEQFSQVIRRHQRMAKAAKKGMVSFNIPTLLAKSTKRRAIFMEELPGSILTKHFLKNDSATLMAAGAALASLHTAEIKTKLTWNARTELLSLNSAADDLCIALPSLSESIGASCGQLAARLETVRNYKPCPIHANFFGDQMLVDGATISIVDWDDLSAGDPAFDLGRVFAHLLYEENIASVSKDSRAVSDFMALKEAYVNAEGTWPDEDHINWHICCALLMRAKISALRMLPSNWEHKIYNCSELVKQILSSGTSDIFD